MLRENKTEKNPVLYPLFLYDLARLMPDDPIKYETKEPGYKDALISAYLYAFMQPLEEGVNENFLKGIHTKAIRHPFHTPGKYKTTPNRYPIKCLEQYSPEVSVTIPNMTKNGFWQFVNTWFINQEKPIHFIHIKNAHTPLQDPNGIYLYPCDTSGELGLFVKVLGDSKVIHSFNFSESPRDVIDLIDQAITVNTKVIVNTLPSFILAHITTESIHERVEWHFKNICSRYNLKIKVATNPDEVLLATIECAQLIAQLHGFLDGNTRVAYITLNRLLHKEKQLLTLLSDPNRLDCFALEELLPMVKEGQRTYSKVSSSLPAIIKDKYMRQTIDLSSYEFNCALPESEFMKKVWHANLNVVLNKPHSFSSISALLSLSLVSKWGNKHFSTELIERKTTNNLPKM